MSESDAAEGRCWFVGLDWATAGHQVCVLDQDGKVLGERYVEHSATTLSSLVEWLRSLAASDLGRIRVGIEVPRGAIVEFLMEQGAAVFTINPKQVDRFRDRFTVAGAKDDRRDALVLASALRTDPDAFRRIVLDDPKVIRLRETSRIDEDLASEQNRLQNRLRELVYRIAAPWLELSPAANDPWFWTLLERVRSPEQATRVKRRVVEGILKDHRIRRVDTDQVLAVLKKPMLTTAPGTTEAVTRHIELLLPRLRLVAEQRRNCARELDALLDDLGCPAEPAAGEHQDTPPSDMAIARSIPGIGRMVAATLFAEASTIIEHRNASALRALSGIAPVTRQSGNRRTVGMRYACNARLREAFYHWARTSTMFDEGSKAYYAKLRSRGHSHGRALRSVADRLLRIFMAMLRSRTLYDAQLAMGGSIPAPA
jgi:transposase